MSSKWSESHIRRTLCLASSIFIVLLIFGTPSMFVSAWNDWQDDDPNSRKSQIEKPVDPVVINVNGNPQYRVRESLGIPIGESWELDYYLEAGKKYHIFLVGDWICNETEPTTDYDIKTVYPNGNHQWNTESAGLPEQVANDGKRQYFIPPLTGTYRFNIINDIRDSKDTEGAVFMLIEHIDVNVEYSQDLEGRDDDGSEVLLSGWAYEICTSAPRIRVFVDVPDSLDMYEVRLYMMANTEAEIGYDLHGIGAPTGDLFLGFQGQYGGFSTSCKGDRNIDAMDSCERSGMDMEFVYDTPNAYNETGEIYYYLVLIAEHDIGTVKFYAQTDFSPPEIALAEPPEIGYAEEKTEIKASVQDEYDVRRVWAEYTDDEWETSDEVDFEKEGDLWACDLPVFGVGDNINYKIHAEDKFGNTGSADSGFIVKKRTSIKCSIDDVILMGDERAEIRGSTSLNSAPIMLQFTHADVSRSYSVATDENGDFDFVFKPDKIGDWEFQASFEGNDMEVPSESDIITFEMKSRPTHISSIIGASRVKINQPVVVSGSVSPGEAGFSVEVLFVSSDSSQSKTVLTGSDGSYTCSFVPTENGVWNAISKVGDGLYYASSQSELMEFTVVPLNVFDKVSKAALMMVVPPYMYVTLGLTGAGTSAILFMKRERLASLLPKSKGNKKGKTKAKEKGRNRNGGKRYRRAKKG